MTKKEKQELIEKIKKTPLNNNDKFVALIVLMVKLFNKYKLERELSISYPTLEMWSKRENLPYAAMRRYTLDRFAELLKK